MHGRSIKWLGLLAIPFLAVVINFDSPVTVDNQLSSLGHSARGSWNTSVPSPQPTSAHINVWSSENQSQNQTVHESTSVNGAGNATTTVTTTQQSTYSGRGVWR